MIVELLYKYWSLCTEAAAELRSAWTAEGDRPYATLTGEGARLSAGVANFLSLIS
jgi:hypothetical protein